MSDSTIVDRGRGPEIAGTRITVYSVMEYLKAGRSRDYIAATLNLSSAQVESAVNFIRQHQEQLEPEFERIMERIQQGNPEWVEQRLKQNRRQLKALREQLHARRGEGTGHAHDHVG